MKINYKINKLFAIALIVCFIITGFQGFNVFSQESDSGYKDTDFVIAYARDGQSSDSVNTSWDRNIPFPGGDFSKTNENVSTNVLNDGSSEHSSEAYRELNEINGGLVTIDFDFSMDKVMEAAFRLLDNKTTLFGIVTKNNGIYLEQPNGALVFLCPCSASYVTGEFTYVVKAVIDFDSQRIVSVQINGKTYAKDKPYANAVTKANGFDISTSRETVGVLTNRRLFISGGYYVYECFWNANGNLPDDWSLKTETGAASLKTAALRFPDKHSLLLDSLNGSVEFEKSISPVTGNIIFEINTFQSKKRDDFYINLGCGSEIAVSVTSDGNSFGYINEAGAFVPFYAYMDNVWYHIKLDVDTENSTCDIYLNNKLKVRGAKLAGNVNSIDKISVKSGKNPSNLVIDDILLYRKRIYDDYVSAPVAVEKKDNNTLLCMQMCPLWTEGTHYGWDPIKAASSDREPLLGFYDEHNPEVYDWSIKWMLEHGVDFQFQCVYPVAMINYDIVSKEPIKNNMVREFNGLTSGFMNAKYSDQMKFAVILECTTFFHGYEHNDEFFNYYLPFYIEYYLKDDRYMKIDGRPVIGVFSLKSFLNIFDDGTGDESIKKGIKKFRQVCIDAGVGNPYILSNDSTASNLIKMAADAGLDGITAYGLGGSATFTTQKANMQSTVELCKAEGIDFWPIATPVRDDIAWRIYSGYSHTGEEFTEHLSWMQNDLMPSISSSVSKKVINMTTWDEYGEGHIIAPTVGKQFEYLDSIRKVFSKDSDKHEDLIPTDEQKKRMDMLYVQDRKTVLTKTDTEGNNPTNIKVIQGEREYDTPKNIPENIKKGYYFTTAKDAAKCTPLEGVSEIVGGNTGIIVNPNSANPTITLNEKLDMDAYDVTYAKLRMKKNPTSGGGWLSWSSDLLPGFSGEHKVYFNPGTDNGSEFKDYYIPVGKSAFWKGKISNIKLQLGDISEHSTPFVVESIEFLSDNEITNADKIVVDGWIQKAKPSIKVKDGIIMVPLRQTLFSSGASYVRSFESTDTYSCFYNDVYAEIKIGETSAYVGNKKVALPAAAFKNSDIVNDEVFVPVEFVSAVLSDKNISWNEKERTLNIVSVAGENGTGSATARKLIASIDFDSASDFETSYGIDNMSFKDGILSGTTSSNDPQMMFKLNIPAAETKLVEIKMNTAGSQNINFYFITDKDQVWNEFKRSPAYPTNPGDNIIRIDTVKDVGNWQDTIKNLRLDPADDSGQTFTIDYIRFYGDEIKESGMKKDLSSCVLSNEEGYEWQFSKNTYLDGWQGNKFLGSVEVQDGALNAVIIGKTPILMNRRNIGIDCEKIKGITIKYKNNTLARKAKLYFITDKTKALNEAALFELKVKPMDSGFTEYSIDTAESANWNGKLLNLVFVPAENMTGSVLIDNIKLQYR